MPESSVHYRAVEAHAHKIVLTGDNFIRECGNGALDGVVERHFALVVPLKHGHVAIDQKHDAI